MTPAETVDQLIERLDLAAHPEGGWFRETWRSNLTVPTPFGDRPAGTSILYLLAAGQVSRMHRLNQDEVWHYHAGPGLDLHLFTEGYGHRRLAHDEAAQMVVPAGAWMAAEVGRGWALVGCTCSPGFHFDDLEFAERHRLLASYPDHGAVIERLT